MLNLNLAHFDCKMGLNKSKEGLNNHDLDFLMTHTNLDGNTVKEWYNGFRRDCPSGRLTQEQFYDMYKMFSPNGNAEKFSRHVFRTFDTDQNGYIDFVEFLLAINITSSDSPEEKLKWAFKLYDVDGDGEIDHYEMTKVVQSVYEMLGEQDSLMPSDEAWERAKKIFIKLDTNGDCRLTEEEFVDGCLKNEDLKNLLTPCMVRDSPLAGNT